MSNPQPDWRTVAEQQAELKCDRFEVEMYELIHAGLPGADPSFALPDWHKRPTEMSVGDILTYVHVRYGELFLGFCRRFEQLRVH